MLHEAELKQHRTGARSWGFCPWPRRLMFSLVLGGLWVLSAGLDANEERHEVEDAESRHEVENAGSRQEVEDDESRHEVEDAGPRDEVEDAGPRHEVEDAESREVTG